MTTPRSRHGLVAVLVAFAGVAIAAAQKAIKSVTFPPRAKLAGVDGNFNIATINSDQKQKLRILANPTHGVDAAGRIYRRLDESDGFMVQGKRISDTAAGMLREAANTKVQVGVALRQQPHHPCAEQQAPAAGANNGFWH